MRSRFYQLVSMVGVLSLAGQIICPISNAKAEGGGNATQSSPVVSSTRFYHGDHLGSTTTLTDEEGVPLENHRYYPYGEVRGTFLEPLETDYGYTGQKWDPETGLNFYGSRYYDGKLGRFISIDPWVNLTRQPYAYANNNPIYYIDVHGDYAMAAALPLLPGFGPVGIAIGIGILVGFGGYVAYEYLKTPPTTSTGDVSKDLPSFQPTHPTEIGGGLEEIRPTDYGPPLIFPVEGVQDPREQAISNALFDKYGHQLIGIGNAIGVNTQKINRIEGQIKSLREQQWTVKEQIVARADAALDNPNLNNAGLSIALTQLQDMRAKSEDLGQQINQLIDKLNVSWETQYNLLDAEMQIRREIQEDYFWMKNPECPP
ncbi:MAG: hypothetical protein HY538_04410 [Deltaproteobacteria bacterium]|nr:hypothetical protein [Deltaproteobacteria bacterium]